MIKFSMIHKKKQAKNSFTLILYYVVLFFIFFLSIKLSLDVNAVSCAIGRDCYIDTSGQPVCTLSETVNCDVCEDLNWVECGGVGCGWNQGCTLACVPDGSCSAPDPACEQTTNGQDNCGGSCSRTGGACACVPDGSCSAPDPACEQTTNGQDNCGGSCSRTGGACACVPDGSCSAPDPACEQTTNGQDNCGGSCSRTGGACACVPDGS